jgi:phytoene/squalene synthetase
LDLLEAFRRDCTRLRYRDWDDLIDYCRYSAMPVGRFVLDVHGESRELWPANDALCAALQVINHLQDCAKGLSRVEPGLYPGAHVGRCGIGWRRWRKAGQIRLLVGIIAGLARQNAALLETSRPLRARDKRRPAWRWKST